MRRTDLEIAKDIIVTYLSKSINIDSANAIYKINGGDKVELLEHIKAIANIFKRAIEELKEEENVSDNN